MIQQILISRIMQPLADFMNNAFSQKTRMRVFTVCISAIVLQTIVLGTRLLTIRFFYSFVFGCFCLGVAILCGLPKQIEPINFDGKLLICWLVFTLFSTISAVLFNVDYFADALLFIFAYPLIYIVWSKAELAKLFHYINKGLAISFLVFLGASIVLAPMTIYKYCGVFNNPNGTAFYLTTVFCGTYMEIIAEPTIKTRRGIKLLILLGMTTAMMFYTNSRTGLLAVVCVVVFVNALQIVRHKKWTGAQFWQFVFPVLLAIIVFIPATLQLFRIQPIIVKAVPEIAPIQEKFGLGTVDEMVEYKLDGFINVYTEKVSTSGKTANQISSGRLQIWTYYFHRLNILGHDNRVHFKVIDVMGRETHNSEAHMTPLEMAYNNGIFCGLFFLIFNIIAGIKSIRYAIEREDDKYAIFPFTITIAFGVVSVLATINNAFYASITLLYFIVQTPLVVKPNKKISKT